MRDAAQVLLDLHVHLYGCIGPTDMLSHLATCERVDWDWYEAEYEAAYGVVPTTRDLVERYRSGDDRDGMAVTRRAPVRTKVPLPLGLITGDAIATAALVLDSVLRPGGAPVAEDGSARWQS